MTEPTYFKTLPAAQVVVLNARSRDEARQLLEMLGLIDADGRIVPDDLRNYDIEDASPARVPTGHGTDNPTARSRHPETCSTPAGLRSQESA